VVAFGSADSHDEHYFAEPDGMIRGDVIDPRGLTPATFFNKSGNLLSVRSNQSAENDRFVHSEIAPFIART
jgi:hypothetical protein